MKKLALTLLVFVGACGAEPPAPDTDDGEGGSSGQGGSGPSGAGGRPASGKGGAGPSGKGGSLPAENGGAPGAGGANPGGSGGSPLPPDAGVDTAPPDASGMAGAGGSMGPTGDGLFAGMTQVFNTKDLGNWEMSPANSWIVKDGAMASTGNGRGYIATKADYGNHRFIFSLRQVKGDHQPCILLFGTRPPPNNALGAIQFQPPNGYTWDYRPGKNNSGGGLFMRVPHMQLSAKDWNRCEVLVNSDEGAAKMACCKLDATGGGDCVGMEVLRFKDPVLKGKKGPIAWQMHNGGIFDEYKDVWVQENPPNINEFITMKMR